MKEGKTKKKNEKNATTRALQQNSYLANQTGLRRNKGPGSDSIITFLSDSSLFASRPRVTSTSTPILAPVSPASCE